MFAILTRPKVAAAAIMMVLIILLLVCLIPIIAVIGGRSEHIWLVTEMLPMLCRKWSEIHGD